MRPVTDTCCSLLPLLSHISLGFLVLVLYPSVPSVLSSSPEDPCDKRRLQQREKACNPYLGAITTAILAATSTNFTHVCSAFELYVTCIEKPSIVQCDPTLIQRYWENKLLYAGDPYLCDPPAHLDTFHNLTEQRSVPPLIARHRLEHSVAAGAGARGARVEGGLGELVGIIVGIVLFA